MIKIQFFTYPIIMYYNYHMQIKKRLREGKLIKFELVEKWKDISPALVLYFNDKKIMPVREEYFNEYLDLISSLYDNIENNLKYN